MNKISELFSLSKAKCILLKTGENIKDENFYYITGLNREKNLNSILLMNKNQRAVVLANVLECATLKNNKNFRTVKFDTRAEFEGLMKKYTGKKVGLNFSKTSLTSMKYLRKTLKGRKFSDISESLGKVRTTKTREELGKISMACKITSEILGSVPDMVKIGMKETDLLQKIEGMAKKSGVGFSFDVIIGSGKNSSVPHHQTGASKIERGKVLLVDMGVSYKGYCSDVTRTFFVGRPPENVSESYRFVKSAQKKAFSLIKEGVKSRDVFNAANNFIKKEFGQGMIHSLGHGIGLEVHDFPEGLSDKSKYILKENMVLAIEPASYGRNFGIRIEDNLVVKKNGYKPLTKSSENIVEI